MSDPPPSSTWTGRSNHRCRSDSNPLSTARGPSARTTSTGSPASYRATFSASHCPGIGGRPAPVARDRTAGGFVHSVEHGGYTRQAGAVDGWRQNEGRAPLTPQGSPRDHRASVAPDAEMDVLTLVSAGQPNDTSPRSASQPPIRAGRTISPTAARRSTERATAGGSAYRRTADRWLLGRTGSPRARTVGPSACSDPCRPPDEKVVVAPRRLLIPYPSRMTSKSKG